eukprot:Unigene9349_Nuclearia_a/m.28533 Unigene9349_Nuclearia_a/g.28533  ORF Unigene9349_Nuclearia_a/g.28533 Unigene9349_Nuclearia_a/m.28533 type:complete len:505 (-) Unigene9349_Nuclearia_a:96-1610(-)
MNAALVVAAAGSAALVALLVTRYVLMLWRAGDVLKMPGPKLILPIVGTFLAMPPQMIDRTKHEDWWPRLFEKWGRGRDYFRIVTGTLVSVHTRNPDVIKLIIANPKHLKKPWIYGLVFSKAFGDGLVTSTGDKWKMDRNAITPTFHFEVLRNYAEVMNRQSDILVERFRQTPSGEVCPDASNLLNMCAFDVILETAMGVAIHAQTTSDRHFLTDAFQRGAEVVTARIPWPWLHNDWIFYNFTADGRQAAHDIERLHAFTQKIIDTRRKAIKEDPDAVQKTKRKAFLDLLLTTPKSDGTFFTDKELIDQVNTFIGAGHDTTGSSTVWCLQLLGHHQEVQQKLYEEIMEVVGDAEEVTLDHLGNMKYLEMVVKEGLRIYPSVPMYARELEMDVQVDEFLLKKGTIIAVHVLAMHRSKELWGPDADVFDPERWTPEREKGRHPYAFIPFSVGSRNCVGQKFAIQEEKIMLIKILRAFRIESVKQRIPSVFQVVLNPIGGVPLRIFHR